MENTEISYYNPELVSIAEKELKEIDKKNILNNRIEFLANVLAVIKNKEYKYSDIKLIECGAHPVDIDSYTQNSKYQPSVAYFFANYPDFLEYKGYDKTIDTDNKLIEKGITKNKEKFALKPEQVLANIKSQYIGSKFCDLVRETYSHKKLVICSNYVLGPADENYPFWNIPGLHIHQFLDGDFEKEGIIDERKKHQNIFSEEWKHFYKTLENKLKAIYHLNSDLKLFKGSREFERIAIYEN